MPEEILASVQVRRDNKANWEAVNPVLLDGEAVYEKDTDMFKIGDGVNSYKNLPYHNKVGPKGDTGATPQISMRVSTGAAGSEASVSVSGTAENPLISLTIPRGDTGASGVTKETDPTVPDWAKQPNKPSYTAQEVGADSAGAASTQIATHNTNTSAHTDIRTLISELTNRFNALADSDDTTLDQLSEIVAYIKSNKTLIDAVTTGKVSVSDIVDNLTTNASGKVLSAAQGVELKAMIDGIVRVTGNALDELNAANATQDAEIAKKANDSDLAKVAKSGSYTDLTNKPTIPTVPSTLPNPNALTFTGAVNETYDGSAAKSVAIPTIPESLKNPNKLILTGAVTAEYDGSAEVSVDIPAGGSGSYTLPIASATQLGGVMPVAKTSEMTHAVGVDEAGGLWTEPGGGGGGWTLKETINVEAGTSAIKINFDKPPREVLIDGRITADKNATLYVIANVEHSSYASANFAAVSSGININGSKRFTVSIEKIINRAWMVRFNSPTEGVNGINQLANNLSVGWDIDDINFIYLMPATTELSIMRGDIKVYVRGDA